VVVDNLTVLVVHIRAMAVALVVLVLLMLAAEVVVQVVMLELVVLLVRVNQVLGRLVTPRVDRVVEVVAVLVQIGKVAVAEVLVFLDRVLMVLDQLRFTTMVIHRIITDIKDKVVQVVLLMLLIHMLGSLMVNMVVEVPIAFQVMLEQSVSSGQVLLAHSHQQVQATYNGTFY
jgi:hypothetical protein